MKKIIYTFLTIALLASCADFLDIRTEATMPTSGTDYSKSELIFQSVSAAYATLRLSEGDAFAYVSVLEMPCDDADKGSTPSDAAATALSVKYCRPTFCALLQLASMAATSSWSEQKAKPTVG